MCDGIFVGFLFGKFKSGSILVDDFRDGQMESYMLMRIIKGINLNV